MLSRADDRLQCLLCSEGASLYPLFCPLQAPECLQPRPAEQQEQTEVVSGLDRKGAVDPPSPSALLPAEAVVCSVNAAGPGAQTLATAAGSSKRKRPAASQSATQLLPYAPLQPELSTVQGHDNRARKASVRLSSPPLDGLGVAVQQVHLSVAEVNVNGLKGAVEMMQPFLADPPLPSVPQLASGAAARCGSRTAGRVCSAPAPDAKLQPAPPPQQLQLVQEHSLEVGKLIRLCCHCFCFTPLFSFRM